jgi:hypothetical protein
MNDNACHREIRLEREEREERERGKREKLRGVR